MAGDDDLDAFLRAHLPPQAPPLPPTPAAAGPSTSPMPAAAASAQGSRQRAGGVGAREEEEEEDQEEALAEALSRVSVDVMDRLLHRSQLKMGISNCANLC